MKAAIRPVAAGDQAQFLASVARSRGLHHPWVTAPQTEEAFAKYLARFDSPGNLGFVVYEVQSGNLAGAINLTNIVFGAFQSGYLGYFAFEGFQGKGYMKAGLNALVRHAFQNIRLHRLEANIQPINLPSIALVRSCGFTMEGYSPAYLKIAGKWRDHERWAIVRGRKHAAQPLSARAPCLHIRLSSDVAATPTTLRNPTMSMLEKAIALAATAHAGQVDKAGQPYILHPLRVMLRVTTQEQRMAAVLHDVVEDTSVTFDDLRAQGFPESVIEAVRALTKLPGESRIAAAERAARNPIALVVKLADNAENMDLSRIPEPSEKDLARLKEYEAVRALLLSRSAV